MHFNDPKELDDHQVFDDPKRNPIGSVDFDRSRVIPSSSIVIPIHDEWILEYWNARISRNFYKISDHPREENPFYSDIWTFYVAIYTFSQVKQCKTFDKLQGSSRLWPHWRKELCTTEILGGKNERQIFIKPIDSSLLTWPLDFNFKPIFCYIEISMREKPEDFLTENHHLNVYLIHILRQQRGLVAGINSQ